jgi:replicative DNA helicase
MLKIEQTILKNLFRNDQYVAKVYPFLKDEYFTETDERELFNQVKCYIDKYESKPTEEAIVIQMDNDRKVNEGLSDSVLELLQVIQSDTEETPYEWLYDESEKFCKERSIYNAITEAIKIADGSDDKSPDAIPSLLEAALGVCFDTDVGLEYLSNDRYDLYADKEDKLPFLCESLNFITNGGMSRKSSNIVMAPTGVGKSNVMVPLASDYLRQGYNVLYITLEMSERKITERFDANLLEVPIQDLYCLKRSDFNARLDRVRQKSNGRLFVKEYPTSSAHAGHFDALINEIRTKENCKLDVVFVDYLNICISSRVKMGSSNQNTYTYMRSIGEELRGLFVRHDVVGWTATQTNRSAIGASDYGQESVSDSAGIIHIADLLWGLILDDQMKADGEIVLKQLKNRYSGTSAFERIRMKMSREYMKFSDHEVTLQAMAPYMKKERSQPQTKLDYDDTAAPPMIKPKPKKDFNSFSFE